MGAISAVTLRPWLHAVVVVLCVGFSFLCGTARADTITFTTDTTIIAGDLTYDG